MQARIGKVPFILGVRDTPGHVLLVLCYRDVESLLWLSFVFLQTFCR